VNIGAVLLAAGGSHRFGTGNKLLANIGGKPLIRWLAEEITHNGAGEVVVVTGCDHLLIENALESLPLRFAHNLNWTAGVGSSIAIGILALGSQSRGAFIIPGDMPFLTSALLKDLVTTFDQSRCSIVYPTTLMGEQRNPVLWPQRFFPLLTSLRGSEGASICSRPSQILKSRYQSLTRVRLLTSICPQIWKLRAHNGDQIGINRRSKTGG